jgi:hypothetical protein
MERMAESIMNVATTLPEGVPLAAKGLLHLGSRAAVDQTLSRLAARGELIRASRHRCRSSRFILLPVEAVC